MEIHQLTFLLWRPGLYLVQDGLGQFGQYINHPGLPDFFDKKAPNLKKDGTKKAPDYFGPFYCIFGRIGRVNFSKSSEFAQDF